MIEKLATKRDINGNTYKLLIDHEKKTYTTEPAGFFHRSDYMTITKRDMRRIREEIKAAGYTATEN